MDRNRVQNGSPGDDKLSFRTLKRIFSKRLSRAHAIPLSHFRMNKNHHHRPPQQSQQQQQKPSFPGEKPSSSFPTKEKASSKTSSSSSSSSMVSNNPFLQQQKSLQPPVPSKPQTKPKSSLPPQAPVQQPVNRIVQKAQEKPTIKPKPNFKPPPVEEPQLLVPPQPRQRTEQQQTAPVQPLQPQQQQQAQSNSKKILIEQMDDQKMKSNNGHMEIDHDCVEKYQELKFRQKYRYLIFKINNFKLQIEKTGANNLKLDDFLKQLPFSECRYAIYDHQSSANKMDKVFFVTWLPSAAPTNLKILYSSERQVLIPVFPGSSDMIVKNVNEILSSMGEKSKVNKGHYGDDDDESDAIQDPDWMDQ